MGLLPFWNAAYYGGRPMLNSCYNHFELLNLLKQHNHINQFYEEIIEC